jgi:hypothetical protein
MQVAGVVDSTALAHHPAAQVAAELVQFSQHLRQLQVE